MTSPRQVIANTLEQILSADHSRIGALAGKAAMDIAFFLTSGQLSLPRSAVLRGLNATPGVGLSIDIAPGELAFYDAAAGVDSSQYQLGRNASTTNLLIAAADPANPRVDLIHGTPTSTDSDSQVRNVLTLPSRVVTPVLVNKTREPTMTLAVTTGTPAASPVAPAGPAGALPLWYVFVPAAFAGPFTDSELADGRPQFNPTEIIRSHGRIDGLVPVPVGLTTNLTFQSGSAVMDGALGRLTANVTLDANDIFSAAAGGPVAADTEYHLYSIIKGRISHPVAKTLEMILGIRLDPPLANGRPSGAIYTYRPLQGLHDEWVHTVVGPQALYLGSAMSTSGAVWQIGGDSVALNLDGSTKEAVYTGTTPGLAGGVNGFTRKPRLSYLSASSVRLEECGPLITGVPGFNFALTATMPGSLVSGDIESASTWYYVYLRNAVPGTSPVAGGVVRNYTLVISTEAPSVRLQKPTPEATFSVQDYLFVGSFFNNASSDIEPYDRIGDLVLWRELTTIFGPANPATTPAFTTIQALMPDTSRGAIINAGAAAVASGAGATLSVIFSLYANTTVAAAFMNMDLTTILTSGYVAGDAITDSGGQLIIPTSSAGQFRANRNAGTLTGAGTALRIDQVGYVENVEFPLDT